MEKQNRVESYRIIAKKGYGEIVEKKSRFIATLAPVDSEEEALAFVEAVRKKYYDARHNCFAFITGRDGKMEKCSDDGEPSGTAGRPMLEVLRGRELTNVAVVATRYFGGTLLGTGGLVRAYTQAVQAALEDCDIITMRLGLRYRITADYTLTGKLQHLFAKRQVTIEDTVYTDKVAFCVLVPFAKEETLKKDVTEATAAKAGMEKIEEAYYEDSSRDM